MVKITAVIITFNEENNIGRCIDSLISVADEILVVDSFSRDRTKAICLEKGVRFIENHFTSFGSQKNFAAAQAVHDCVLSLDADEHLSEALKKSVLQVKETWPTSAYAMNRLNKYGSKWIRHGSWYPDRKIRLWDRRYGKFVNESLHEYVSMDVGVSVQRLRGDIMHEASEDISMLMRKTQRYSEIFAGMHAHRKKSSPFKMLYRSKFAFFQSYFLKFGFLDGYEGFVIASSIGNDVWYKYAKLYETNRSTRTTLIISTYNQADALELVLLSVLRLSVMPEEIIIAYAGSSNEMRELVADLVLRFKIPVKHCWHADDGFKLSAVRNRAIAMATQPYIVLVDDDMVMAESFIDDHKRAASYGRLVQGSVVRLGSKATAEALVHKRTRFSFFSPGIENRRNALHNGLLSSLFSYYSKNVYRAQRASMGFWRAEAVAVNGFNEAFVDRGQADTEFMARMQHAGVRKYHLKFGGAVYSLHHPDHRRDIPETNGSLQQTIPNQSVRCDNGIDKYL